MPNILEFILNTVTPFTVTCFALCWRTAPPPKICGKFDSSSGACSNMYLFGGGGERERGKGFLRKRHDNVHMGTKTLSPAPWPLPTGRSQEAMVQVRPALASRAICPCVPTSLSSLYHSPKLALSQMKTHLPRCQLIAKVLRLHTSLK